LPSDHRRIPPGHAGRRSHEGDADSAQHETRPGGPPRRDSRVLRQLGRREPAQTHSRHAPGVGGTVVISFSELPTVNAMLNATSAVFLGLGYWCIRRKRVAAHRACMLVAVAVSVLFLVSYLTYHAHIGSKHFAGQGLVRPVYRIILCSHTILAMV